ncbi:DUF3047 domain-containing protein [Amphritea sp. 1_MG-2023]|uniref:DUF3047 domain-containing protein n=1 Tax=Amphritea sp. 1_MG-2023 TaxID=3062670 RepID=UPI0026E2A55B|nr:DUF3047 domain-containing protein [Amphritea sp. 1_MG-2023]MDO6562262.1 DUF3047 domain-containing protein [Amphritea sp. 1_MG-2023]
MYNIYSAVRHYLCLVLFIITSTTAAQASNSLIPAFDRDNFQQWESENFVGETRYSLMMEDDNEVLEAYSDNSASGLYYKKTLPITSATRLSWRWKISTTWPAAVETTKTGDDFPVRVYIVVSDGPFFWQKRTLVYVWSNTQPINSRWDNPFTNKAHMWAVDSGPERISQWTHHSRNLQTDLKTAFGKTYTEIEAVAIMTDSDNGGMRFLSWYDDLQLN